MKLDWLPRIHLATLPTPVEELPRLSAQTGCRIQIKRDDLTGLALGGNKTRKLEFLAADAQEHRADTLVTAGAPQSNHCRQTAAAAARLGMRCSLVLAGAPRPADSGNLLLDELLGADLVWCGDRPRDEVLESTIVRLARDGRTPYRIPYGGSNPLGAAAYILAMRELAGQHADPDFILFASSSGGTQAGIALGLRLESMEAQAIGISVDLSADALRSKVGALARETSREMELGIDLPDAQILVEDSYLGGGYGMVGEAEREAIRRFARTEGILLDPVYTGRAAAGMLGLIQSGAIPPGSRVLFWHTGGTPALWSYAEDLIQPSHP